MSYKLSPDIKIMFRWRPEARIPPSNPQPSFPGRLEDRASRGKRKTRKLFRPQFLKHFVKCKI